jgi:hypothetical protein
MGFGRWRTRENTEEENIRRRNQRRKRSIERTKAKRRKRREKVEPAKSRLSKDWRIQKEVLRETCRTNWS